MLEIECDHCGYKKQVLNKELPKDWTYCGDFEYGTLDNPH